MIGVPKPKKRKGKSPKKLAWGWFSRYVRLRDALKTTGTREYGLCVTCGRRYPSFGIGCLQAGHLIPGRDNSHLIDEDFVNSQCYHCNVGLKGNWPPYRRKMVEWYGEEAVQEVEKRPVKIMKPYQWEELAELYKRKFEEL
jgi:hypothetical protein